MPQEDQQTPKRSFEQEMIEIISVYWRPQSLRMLFLGFSSGLPFLLVLGTLSFRLREAHIDRATIGFLTWVGLAYGFKWVWSPLVDRMPLPGLTKLFGRRRSYLLLAQCTIAVGLLGMAWSNPLTNLTTLVKWTVLVAFAAATQDIALDAFRIESANEREQPVMAACYQFGFRMAMIWTGAGALWIAAYSQGSSTGAYVNSAWKTAYTIMAASAAVGLLTTLLSPEPPRVALAPARGLDQWAQEAIVAPFAEFFSRFGYQALLVLMLIGVYRISDVVMGIMANPFYVDMLYTKGEVATVSKVYGVIMSLAGAFVGGSLAMRYGVMKILFLGAVLSIGSSLSFAWLSVHGHDMKALIVVVSADNLAGGIASAAFVGYLSSMTNVRHSATQYALFSSLMLLLPKFLAGFSGAFVNAYGYATFFLGTASLGVPVLLLVWLASGVRQLPVAIGDNPSPSADGPPENPALIAAPDITTQDIASDVTPKAAPNA